MWGQAYRRMRTRDVRRDAERAARVAQAQADSTTSG